MPRCSFRSRSRPLRVSAKRTPPQHQLGVGSRPFSWELSRTRAQTSISFVAESPVVGGWEYFSNPRVYAPRRPETR